MVPTDFSTFILLFLSFELMSLLSKKGICFDELVKFNAIFYSLMLLKNKISKF